MTRDNSLHFYLTPTTETTVICSKFGNLSPIVGFLIDFPLNFFRMGESQAAFPPDNACLMKSHRDSELLPFEDVAVACYFADHHVV